MTLPTTTAKRARGLFDAARGSSEQRGYGRASGWRELSELVRRQEPLCRECLIRQNMISPNTNWWGKSTVRFAGHGVSLASVEGTIISMKARGVFAASAGHVATSEHVDHIIPKSKGGTGERDNLQGLCKTCHGAKTAKESSGW